MREAPSTDRDAKLYDAMCKARKQWTDEMRAAGRPLDNWMACIAGYARGYLDAATALRASPRAPEDSIRALLKRWLAFAQEPAGLTEEIVLDKAKFLEWNGMLDERQAKLVADTEAALAGEKNAAGQESEPERVRSGTPSEYGESASNPVPAAPEAPNEVRYTVRDADGTLRHIQCSAHDAGLLLTGAFADVPTYVALPKGWIAVEDRLPPAQRMVLMACPTSQRAAVQYGFFDFAQREFMTGTAGGWEPVRYTGKPVTHWMELPSAPFSQDGQPK